VNLRVRSTRTGALQEAAITFPVIHSIELRNGFRFIASRIDDGWQTRVARVPSGANTTLQVGDVIVAEAQTHTVMQDVGDLELALGKLGESAAQSAYFTVSRNGKLDSARISLEAF
jgi:hypothetical protein